MTSTRETLQSVVARLAEVIDQLPADPPEVPETVTEWPENDEHLRGEFWKDRQGDVITYTGDGWMFWLKRMGQWAPLPMKPGYYLPLTRTTDPTIPRTWDTLDDVPADVERATGDYAGVSRELARGELSGSGWFQRVLDNAPRRWAELPAAETKNITNIQEDQS